MVALKKYSLAGEELGEVQVSDDLASVQLNAPLVKDYLVALRANARQWSANTKGRSDVVCTGKKPHKQKGTGRARQGSLAASQYKGGGVVFGPRPKFDQRVKRNKKEKRAAIKGLLAEKIRSELLLIVDDLALEQPKTKQVSQFMTKLALGKRVLFVGDSERAAFDKENQEAKVSVSSDKYDNFAKSVRNIPKTSFALASHVNGYDIILANHLVMTESALGELIEWLS